MAASGNAPQDGSSSFLAELWAAITGRTFFLICGVFVVQVAFVFSYVGAFHHPTPHRVPLLVSAPAQLSERSVAALNGLAGRPLQATATPDQVTGLRQLHQGSTDGVLVIHPTTGSDTLYVASGGGAALSAALEQVIGRVEVDQHRRAAFIDAIPAQSGDGRGLSGFYLVIGWLIGGYLAAALLSLAHGPRSANRRRAAIRLIAVGLYAIVSGIGGAIIVDPVLGALTGHFIALWWLGALLVFSAAAVTMAFQAVAGVLGIGITIVLFVVLGNPSAGGAYPPPLLPGFWRVISPYIPNGAGVAAVRRVVYFGAHGITGNLAVILIYTALGVLVTLAVPKRTELTATSA